ncbi:MAG: hypothetical protein AAF623_06070 [Planctomycetota bacterium]
MAPLIPNAAARPVFVLLGLLGVALGYQLQVSVGSYYDAFIKSQPDGQLETVDHWEWRMESSTQSAKKHNIPFLPNCFEVTEGVFSGGQPDGRKGFEQLSQLGIQSIVSVDGAVPDIYLADQFKLKYVHLPNGYDGIDADQAKRLVKALETLPRPIYIHCHHGQHRGPAATAVACIGSEIINHDQALQFLNDAGTSEHYLGLYRSVASAKVFSLQARSGIQVHLPSVSPPKPFLKSMVLADRHFENLVRFRSNQWKPISDHPDLDPAHEALMLTEQFAELLRTESGKPPEYRLLLDSTKKSSHELHQVLIRLGSTKATQFDLKSDVLKESGNGQKIETLNRLLSSIQKDCQTCHRQHRN